MELKENYHRDMEAYKRTDNHRKYAEYLASFKLKYSGTAGTHKHQRLPELATEHSVEDKRPKLEHEDSRESKDSKESTASGGSAAGREASDPPRADASMHESRRRVDSMSSAGPMQLSEGLPSPASATGGALNLRGALAPILSHSMGSPISTSPSSPSLRRDSSTGPMPATVLQPRPFIDANADFPPYPGRSQQLHRNTPYRDGPPHRSSSLGPSIDPRLREHETHSPVDEERLFSRPIPKLLHQTTSSSSNVSLGSGMSTGTADTTASSDYDRPQLPPLSATGLHKPGGKMADYALRPSQPPSTSGSTTPGVPHHPYQPPPSGSPSFSGMKFEFLQLPAPYNVAFSQQGQPPLPRPENEGRLANIFELQDVPARVPPRSLAHQPLADHPHASSSMSSARETRNAPLQPLQPVLPRLRPGPSGLPRNNRPMDPGVRPDEDRLAFLADVADADRDRRSGS